MSAAVRPYADAAMAYLSSGLGGPVPLAKRDKDPPEKGWTGHGAPYPSGADVATWVEDKPEHNIALRLALTVLGLDVDQYEKNGKQKQGARTLARLEEQLGPLPPTVSSTSRSDGVSGIRLYRVPAGLSWPGELEATHADKTTTKDVEVIHSGYRYVAAPPSIHPSGASYAWLQHDGTRLGRVPCLDELPALPEAWVAYLTKGVLAQPSQKVAVNDAEAWDWLQSLDVAPECLRTRELTAALAEAIGGGSRHDSVKDEVLRLVRAGEQGHEGVVAALEAGHELFVETVTADRSRTRKAAESEWRRLVVGAIRLVLGTPSEGVSGTCLCVETLERAERHAPTLNSVVEPPAAFACTDYGNAQRLIARHGALLRYVKPWNRWLVWTGQLWANDETGIVMMAAKDTVRAIAEELIAGHGDRKVLLKHALHSEAEPRLRAMIALAGSEPGIPLVPDQLDVDPWLLNVANGTLDLHTGRLRAHNPLDLLTKLAPVHYDPTATCPTWDRFLARVLDNDIDLVAFVQRAVGYSLTADTGEQVMFLPWGPGANGKSTFLERLRELLGDYAQAAPADLLMRKRDGGIPNDVARLRGARFVSAVETEDGRHLSESTVKQLTGGDTITARFMRAEFFEFRPVAKLWLGSNHRPIVRGTDDAIWRRLRLIPFTVTIPEQERDKALPDRLRQELPGILAWAVRGCLDWQRDGLGHTKAVDEATTGYRSDSDVLGEFLAQCTDADNDSTVKAGVLYMAYTSWCLSTGERAMTQRELGLRLGERGLKKEKSGTVSWRGLKVKPWTTS